MSSPKTFNRADIATYSDHELITPDTRYLRQTVRALGPDEQADDPVARAEAALQQMSCEFAGWMEDECNRLDLARHQVRERGLDEKTRQALFLAAHDLKGGSATYGYPAAAPAADSLCRLLDHSPGNVQIPMTLIDQHVDAVRAIVREYARPDIMMVASALSDKLRGVTDTYLVDVNRHRPEYIEQVVCPPLSPPL